jgi:hypothetical protein
MTLSSGAAIIANSATIKNTILAGSINGITGSLAGSCGFYGTLIDAGYNISDDATCEFHCHGKPEQHQSHA